jgi:DNA-binding transcriptional LysR family regulator
LKRLIAARIGARFPGPVNAKSSMPLRPVALVWMGPAEPSRLTGIRSSVPHESTRAVVDVFRAERPDITVAFRHYPIAATHAGLDAGEVDLAVLRLPVVLTGLHTLTLYTEPRVALLPSDHPLASRARIHLADLAGLPWITTAATDPVWQAHAQPLAGNRDKQNPPVVVDTLDEFLETVTAGRGVGLAPASASRLYARPGVAFIEVADAEPSVGALAWREGVPDANPTVAAFIRSARQLLRRQRRGHQAVTGY